ncbi:MAG: hypothetical protein GWP69_17810 [Gammaproteobacteria bacterium]|nr:hypothetical protein [Gammaproteobacteria bacterium]NCF80697.1 hypothetical protein [Pseudomonadota bacterium]
MLVEFRSFVNDDPLSNPAIGLLPGGGAGYSGPCIGFAMGGTARYD